MDMEQYKEVSVHLPFEEISNARDLAGIPVKEGKVIRPGKLIRSGKLSRSTKVDRSVLEQLGVTDIIDLRTEWEAALEPDHKIEGAELHVNPVFHEKDLKKMAGNNIELAEMAAKDSKELMEDAYAGMVTSPDAIKAWKNLFSILLNAQGGVLWHCTQGKDRTGMAAALIEHALGVDEEAIADDYLQTNLYMSKEAAEDRMMASAVFKKDRPLADEDISSYLFAHRSYYDAMNRAILEHYGSWHNYMEEALGLMPSDFDLLREKYLI